MKNITESVHFSRWPRGDATMTALTRNTVYPGDIQQITEICNQPRVYDELFAHRFRGRHYTQADAKEFVDTSHEEWQAGECFKYVIRSKTGEIVGALDIKSNTLESSEIGYWADERAPGYMSNAVAALCAIAKEAGYRQLYARISPNNVSSQNVVRRNDFTELDGVFPDDTDGGKYIKFIREL